jgi:phosphoenolpyruvate carboxykinase (ATP)
MGEVKKAHLRMAMWLAKQQGWLGLHAASKLIKIKTASGKIVDKGAILFGLSGTGKTTLSCHNHGLSGDEGVTIRQDDVVLMRGDGFCFGTEDNFYLKTEGLEPKGQPLLYKAAISPNAVFENVHVAEDGKVDFLNYSVTSNGRGVVFRSDMKPYSDGEIDLPRTDMLIFIIRRRDIVPPVARLNHEQAAAMFMLGESVETSAGDPTQAGKALRVVGTNPFIVGPAEEEGNIFLKLLESNPSAECFALNTGRVGGKDGENITVVDSANIVKQIARGAISWVKDPNWGFEVPEKVEGMDYSKFDLKRFYTDEQLKEHVKKLKQERREWLGQFKSLKPEIAASLGL